MKFVENFKNHPKAIFTIVIYGIVLSLVFTISISNV